MSSPPQEPDAGVDLANRGSHVETSDNTSSREDALAHEIDRLRAEAAEHARVAASASRLLENLRSEHDRFVRDATGSKAKADAKQISELVIQREQLRAELETSQNALLEAEKRLDARNTAHDALERVCMDLRRRLAVAHEHKQKAADHEKAVLAQETAEARLADAKAENDELRVKLAAAKSSTANFDKVCAERSSLKTRVKALERELKARDKFLTNMDAEQARLTRHLSRLESQLHNKEITVQKLLRQFNGVKHRPIAADEDHSAREYTASPKASSSGSPEHIPEDDSDESVHEDLHALSHRRASHVRRLSLDSSGESSASLRDASSQTEVSEHGFLVMATGCSEDHGIRVRC